MSGHSKWHNIQKTKGAADAKRAQDFTKIAREMIVAVKLLPLSDDVDEIVKMDKIFVYDSYGTEAGFVETLKAALMDKGFKGSIKAFAVPNVYVQHATIAEQEEEFGLDIDSVIKQLL